MSSYETMDSQSNDSLLYTVLQVRIVDNNMNTNIFHILLKNMRTNYMFDYYVMITYLKDRKMLNYFADRCGNNKRKIEQLLQLLYDDDSNTGIYVLIRSLGATNQLHLIHIVLHGLTQVRRRNVGIVKITKQIDEIFESLHNYVVEIKYNVNKNDPVIYYVPTLFSRILFDHSQNKINSDAIHGLHVTYELLAIMIHSNTISGREAQQFGQNIPHPEKQIMLVNYLMQRPNFEFDMFLDALTRSGQQSVAKQLSHYLRL